MLPRWRGSLWGQAIEVGPGLLVIGIELKGVEKIGTGSGGAARAGLKDAEIVPAIGVVGLEVKREALLIDGLGKISAGVEELRDEGVDFRIVRVAGGGFAELLESIVASSGLGEGHGEMLAGFEIIGLLLNGGLKKRDGLLGLAGRDGVLAELGESGEVGGIELEGALELVAGCAVFVLPFKSHSETTVGVGIVRALL